MKKKAAYSIFFVFSLFPLFCFAGQIGPAEKATAAVDLETFELVTAWTTSTPKSLALDKQGNLLVGGMGQVSKYRTDGTLLSKISNGTDYFLDPALNAVDVDSKGNIYVVSYGYNYVIKFDPQGKYVKKWGSAGTGDTQFSFPAGISVDADDNIYIGDRNNRRIVKYDTSGKFLAKWNIQVSGEVGPGDFSGYLRVDAAGRVNLIDWTEGFKVFDANGVLIKKWGTMGPGETSLTEAKGIGFDSESNVYIAKYLPLGMRILKFDPNGTFLTQWGGDINSFGPMDVVVDSSNYVYVADIGNNQIMKFRSKWLPTLEIASPLADATVMGTHKIQATASSAIGISKVEVYVDGVKLGDAIAAGAAAQGAAKASSRAISGNFVAASAATYSYDWNTASHPDASYKLKLIATNTQNKTAQQEITVIVNNSNDQLPTISITSPLEGDKVKFGATIKATASDDKRVAKVEFYVDGAKIGEAAAAPYEFVWDASSLTDGTHEVKATAYDSIGQTKSATINVTVVNREEYAFVQKWATANTEGLALDKSGNLYAAGGSAVKKFRPDGTLLMQISSGADYTLNFQARVALDSAGNIYVTAPTQNYVVKFDKSGKYLKKWGSQGSGNNQFSSPYGIAVDSENCIYIGDQGNNRIVKYDAEGTYLRK